MEWKNEELEKLVSLNESKLTGMFLNEAYYSKSPYLQEAERNMDIIVGKIRKNPLYAPDGTKEMIKIKECLKKQFNFEEILFQWIPSNHAGNAFTMPQSLIITGGVESMDVENTKYGVKFKQSKGKTLITVAFSGLVTQTRLTGGEVLAVILHEIGHNFYVAPIFFETRRCLVLYSVVDSILKIVKNKDMSDEVKKQHLENIGMSVAIATKTGRFVLANVMKMVDKLPAPVKFVLRSVESLYMTYNDYKALKRSFERIMDLVKNFEIVTKSRFTYAIKDYKKDLLQLVLFDKYRDEKFADNFATIHGYGPEIAEGMKKMSLNVNTTFDRKIVGYIPGVGSVYNAYEFIMSSVSGLFECHPDEYVRVYDQAKLLKQELKKENLPPSVKKDILADLDKIEKTYSEMASAEFLSKNNEHFKYALYSVIGFTGRDRKDMKEMLFPTLSYDYRSLKPLKDRELDTIQGMFLA